MNDLEEYLIEASDRNETVLEFDTNRDAHTAVLTWGYGGQAVVARLCVRDNKMHAEVSAYRDGVRQAVDVLQLEDAAMIYSRDT
jgi:hypothetical protein